jgi:hypothetical protein
MVRTIALCGLSRAQGYLCFELRSEAGRCWSDMVTAQVNSRREKWLNGSDLEKLFKRKSNLQAQTIQGLAQRIQANLDTTTRELR